jgi:3-isopropylmalate/(R)-2-methylmalate dehydratase small subunit
VIVSGKAVVVPGTNIDTDVLYPGIYLNIDDPDLMKPYLFEGLDPSLRDQLQGDTVLVVGANFGMGLALPAISCPEAAKAAKAGSEISIDAVAGKVTVDGREFVAAPVPPFMLEMLERGGLIPWAQHKLAQS